VKLQRIFLPLGKDKFSVATVEGYATQHGKSGVRGRVVERSGGLTARARRRPLQGLGQSLSQNYRTAQGGLNAVTGAGGLLGGEKLVRRSRKACRQRHQQRRLDVGRLHQTRRAVSAGHEMPTGISIEIVFLSGFQVKGRLMLTIALTILLAPSQMPEPAPVRPRPSCERRAPFTNPSSSRPRPARLHRSPSMKFTAKVIVPSALALGLMACRRRRRLALSKTANNKLADRLQQEFPATKISGVNCDFKVKGLCEVAAGKNVFYATADGQKVFIGEVLDLKSKTNITAARISELASMASAEAKIAGGPQQAAADQTPPPAAAPASVIKVDRPRTTR
jgi:hypothetical protein